MKYYLPLHFNSGNRGCQGITEGTAIILKEPSNNINCYTTDYELDNILGVQNSVNLVKYKESSFLNKISKKIRLLFKRSIYEKRYLADQYYYQPIYRMFSNKNGIMLSTGGDMLCYADNEVNTSVDYAKKKGIKTILWGCSMAQANLTEEKKNALMQFDLIYTRESLSYEFFRNLGLSNVICLPDPAFVLAPTKTQLPDAFIDGDVVALNVSSYVLGGFDLTTEFGRQISDTIDYLLHNTSFNILLLPHVTWSKQDDRIVARNIKKRYNNSRIYDLNIDRLSYSKIRYIISKCRFFIGSRTHAVISAYSTCVPTIALGYSIKSKGIAKDIGLNEKLVVDCNNTKPKVLIESLEYLLNNEQEIHSLLYEKMQTYRMEPFRILDYIKKIAQ